MGIKLFDCLVIVAVVLCLVQLNLGIGLSRYTKLSNEAGKQLKSYVPRKSPGYPQDYGYGYYYQGDMLLRPGQGGRFATNKPFGENLLWPNGRVPFVINANFTGPEMETLLDAFEQFENRTCIQFVLRTDEEQYVTITNEQSGCVSDVGMNPVPYVNRLNLQSPQCMWIVGTAVHELMHTLGFMHEHSRPDRDEYLMSFTQNLAEIHRTPDFIRVNLGKLNATDGTEYGVPYNYGSVMHYSRHSYAVSLDKPVMTSKTPYVGDFGNFSGLAESDIEQLNARYCSE